MPMLITSHQRRVIACRTAPPMFALALLFLVCQAVLVVLWVDVPTLRQSASQTSGGDAIPVAATAGRLAEISGFARGSSSKITVELVTLGLMLATWPLFVAEAIFHWLTRGWQRSTRWSHFLSLLVCLSPSLRICPRSVEMHQRLWLPSLGWRHPNKRLRQRLERHFSVPMILIALLIMPVLIIEFFLKTQVAQYAWLRLALHLGTGVIWFAFTAEFIVMISVAEKKLVYIKDHWLDLAIILLPLISFLRSLQAIRSSRLIKLAKIPQLSKFLRMYRLRGTAIKAFRALVILDLIHRLFRRDPQRRIQRLRQQLKEVDAQAAQLRRRIARLEREESAAADDADPVGPVAATPVERDAARQT